MKRSEVFDIIRKINGKLTTSQVKAGDEIMDKLGEDIVATLLGASTNTVKVTAEQLLKIYPKADTSFVEPINALASKYGITTKQRMAVFLSQTLHETGGYKSLRESLAYSAPRLVAVFPSRVKTLAVAQQLVAKGQSAIGDAIYGGRYGNGTNNGDGYRYRGGGLTHTTFKDNYAAATKSLKANGSDIDLVANPELIVKPAVAVETAMIFWKDNNINSYADKGDIKGASKAVNGGTNGLTERINLYNKALAVL